MTGLDRELAQDILRHVIESRAAPYWSVGQAI